MASQLTITNTDATVGRLKVAGVEGEIVPWWDQLCDGPLPLTPTLEAFSKVRTDYIATQTWAFPRLSAQQFKSRDAMLARNMEFELVLLWFEHDLNDQLQLIQILDWFAANPRPAGTLFLMQGSTYLDELDPEEVQEFLKTVNAVTDAQLMAAQQAWNALRQTNPEYWAYLINMDLSALPYLPSAVERMLQELPDTQTGLGRTARQIVQILRKRPAAPRQIYKLHWDLEEAGILDDWALYAHIDRLATAKEPLFTGKADVPFNPSMGSTNWRRYVNMKLELTKYGFMVIEGHEDFSVKNQVEQYWGGTYVLNKNLWRWDLDNRRLVAPKR